MKTENLKYYDLQNTFRKVLASERIPEKDNSETLAIRPSIYSKSVYVMTENGMTIAYYNHEENGWRSSERDNYTEVVYWLEEIEAKNIS